MSESDGNGTKPPRSMREISKQLDGLYYKPPPQARLDALARQLTLDIHRIYGDPALPPPNDEALAAVTWESFTAEFEAALEEIYGRAGD